MNVLPMKLAAVILQCILTEYSTPLIQYKYCTLVLHFELRYSKYMCMNKTTLNANNLNPCSCLCALAVLS